MLNPLPSPPFDPVHALFDQSPTAIFIIAPNGCLLRSNRAFATLLGYAPEELLAFSVQDLTHPDERDARSAQLQCLWSGSSSVATFKQRFLHRAGSQPRCSVVAQVLRDSDGKAQQIACTVHHHARHQGKALQLELALTAGHLGVWEWDMASGCVTRSPEADRLLGVVDFSGRVEDFQKTLHPADAIAAKHNIARAIETHEHFSNVFRVHRPDGSMRWMQDHGRIEYDDQGVALRALGTVYDITERKEVELALAKAVARLRESELALTRAQEVGGLGSYVTDLTTGRWRSSAMLDRLLGLAPAPSHAPEEWLELLHPDDRQIVLSNLERTLAGTASFDTQYRIVRRSDGEIRWMHGLGEIERNLAGEPLRIFGTVQDITQRKAEQIDTQLLLNENTRLVRELISLQERERAMLARELHDELAQHLTAIRAFAGAIRLAGEHDVERAKSAAQSIEDSARNIYLVSHRLMEGLHPNILDSAGIIDALGVLLDDWGSKHPAIEWRASLSRALVCDSLHLRVAIYRLVQECLSNVARHARASRLRIVLANFPGLAGTMLRLVIRDDGIGMNTDATHSGFGLLGMRERVLSLGGSFRIASWPDGGTRIRVVLPAG